MLLTVNRRSDAIHAVPNTFSMGPTNRKVSSFRLAVRQAEAFESGLLELWIYLKMSWR